MPPKLFGIVFQPSHFRRFDFSNYSPRYWAPSGTPCQHLRNFNAFVSARAIPIWAVIARTGTVSGLLWTAGKPPMAAAQTPQFTDHSYHRYNYIGGDRPRSRIKVVLAGKGFQIRFDRRTSPTERSAPLSLAPKLAANSRSINPPICCLSLPSYPNHQGFGTFGNRSTSTCFTEPSRPCPSRRACGRCH